MTKEEQARELKRMFEKLTPENKEKFVNKYFELLAEQEQQEART